MFTINGNNRLSLISRNIKQAFSKIKEEFSEHLEAINANTNEIQSNYEFLCELDAKIEKLSERMDEVMMMVQHPNGQKGHVYDVQALTKNEMEVFQALYSLVTEKGCASYYDIGRRCCLPENLVQSYVTNLVVKGVPIYKKYRADNVFLTIASDFCELQAKENILGINELISEKVISK